MTTVRKFPLARNPVDAAALAVASSLVRVAQQPDPDFQPVDARCFPRYMRRHAERVQRQLAARGFVSLGDFVIANLGEILGQRVMLRLMRSPDATVDVAIYAISPRWPGLSVALWRWLRGRFRTLRIVEFESHFPGARSLTTNNQGAANLYSYPDDVEVLCLPAGTPVRRVLAEHQRRVGRMQQHDDSSTPLRVRDWAQRQRLANIVAQKKRHYRRAIGYVTDAELRRQCGEHDAQFAQKIRDYITQLVVTPESIENPGPAADRLSAKV